MKKPLFRNLLVMAVVLAMALVLAMPGSRATAQPTKPQGVKNVIYLIGDGMGIGETTMARQALVGSMERLNFEKFPNVSVVTTFSADAKYNNVTDSAAAGTALATGHKTLNQRIAVDENGVAWETLLEAAQREGKKVGIISTNTVYDATPAAFTAHDAARSSSAAIALQIATKGVDVILGGGADYFKPAKQNGRDLVAEMKAQGYTYVTNKDELLAAKGGKLLGLFTPGYMNYVLDRDDYGSKEPTFPEMVKKALETMQNDPDGLFLMAEGARIDHAAHAADAGDMIEEVREFSEGIDVALEWAKTHPDTLIVVGADHETGDLGVTEQIDWNYLKSVTVSAEYIGLKFQKDANGLPTKDSIKSVMKEYAHIDMTDAQVDDLYTRITPGGKYSASYKVGYEVGTYLAMRAGVAFINTDQRAQSVNTGGHTGNQLVFYATGAKSEGFNGILDNTDIAKKIAAAMGVTLGKYEAAPAHTYRADAQALVGLGILDGSYLHYDLDLPATRGEFITAVVKAFGIPASATSAGFTDVPAEWAAGVDAAFAAKIAAGRGSKSFAPYLPVTRWEAEAFLSRAAGKTVKLNLPFGSSTKVLTAGEMAHVLNGLGIAKVTVLSTNDIHGQIDSSKYAPGLPVVANQIVALKAQNPNGTILLDGGDAFQGTPISNVLRGKPIVEFEKAVGYDAVTVGNHEFDWGIDAVIKTRADAEVAFPMLVSNLYDKATGKPVDWAKPYVILNKNGVKIGIIGVSTTETAITTLAANVANIDFHDPVAELKTLVPEVKKQADIVLVLGHVGVNGSAPNYSGDMINIANQVPGIAGVIGGHSHTVLNTVINGVPLLQAGNGTSNVGELDLVYNPLVRKVITSSVKNNPTISSAVTTANETVKQIVDAANGELKPLFDQVVVNLGSDLVRSYNGESGIGNWVTDVTREYGHTQIGFQNAGGVRADVTSGPFTLGEIFTIMPFDNTIVTGELTGKQIKAILEQGTTLYKGMIQVSGLTFKYDSTKEAGSRVIEATLTDGTPIDDNAKYTVSTNNFLATGGDGFVTFKETTWTDTFYLIRDAMIEDAKKAASEGKDLNPQIDGRVTDVSKQPVAFAPLFDLPFAA